MIKKIEIKAELEIKTGMHIGGSVEFAAIGAVDSPIVRDSLTRKPMLPGSSLKGKMRSLLSRQYSDGYMPVEIDNDNEIIKRLFGSAKDEDYKNARLQFVDSILSNEEELNDLGLQRSTEIKFENSISRLTAVANPRQIERVVPGSKFDISIIYNVDDEEKILDDFEAIGVGLKLLEYDYLGGSGTRGYGRIKFNNIEVKSVFGDIDNAVLKACENKLQEDK